jgi:membrane-bound lytic murein transglycosylase B
MTASSVRAALAAALVGAAFAATMSGCGDGGGRDATAAADDPVAATPTTSAPVTSVPTTAPPPPTPTTAPVPATLAPVLAGERPRAAEDPASLATQIAEAEAAIRDPASASDVLDAAGRLQQVAYRRLGEHPEWDEVVLASVPDPLRTVVSRHATARRELRALVTQLSDTLPAWRIVEPAPVEELLAYYQEAESRFGVPWSVLAAVNLVETGLGRIVGLSTAGALGPMQFIQSTWDAYGMGGDVWDPHDAILGAANYLAANGGGNGTSAGIDNALIHYNHSQHYVTGVRAYASLIAEDPRVFHGFHAWEIVYRSTAGDVVLPTGYESAERIPVAEYLAANPQ